MRPLLIGLTGRPLAGKDTIGQMLTAAGFWTMSFADALRHECAAAWGVTPYTFTQRETKEVALPRLAVARCRDIGFRLLGTDPDRDWDLEAPRSPRWVMQQWGTEYRRAQRPDYWVDRARDHIQAQRREQCHRIVITDVRFPNEAECIRRMGGWVLRVHRPELAPMTPDAAAHASERQAALLSADAEIHNDGTLDHLRAEVARVLAALHQADELLTLTR